MRDVTKPDFVNQLAACIMIGAQKMKHPVVFMTPSVKSKIRNSFALMTYADDDMPDTFFGFPIRLVYAPGVTACWVGEQVYAEDMEDACAEDS